jgi:hypothetical protein
LAATAVAAFGTTFHFFGSSAVVPEPSRQFGFWVLSPVALIDKIYQMIFGARLIWEPIPMFLVLWAAYASLALLVFYWANRRGKPIL